MEDVESHPIPQDVTGFQFKIIGDMTIKQFAYLCGSTTVGWIFYQLPITSFIRLPVAIALGAIGPALAFLPIGGRPMDTMIFQFIKAFFKPTRFVYQKTGGSAWLSTVTANAKKARIENVHGPIAPLPKLQGLTPFLTNSIKPQNQSQILQDQTGSAHITSMYSSASQTISTKPAPQPLGQIQHDKKDSLKKKVQDLEKDLEATRKEKAMLEQVQPSLNQTQSQDSLDLEKQLQGMQVLKENLTKQLITLQQKLDLQKKNVYTPAMATPQLNAPTTRGQTQNVKQIPKGMEKNIGLPVAPEAPNIISGIIKDPRGNPLGNILVEVKDKEGNPVRAFKTNGLGQFVSSTALTNGEYTILFEDPKAQNKFDAIEFKANGEVILPIEVTSVDAREELRKSLFGEN